MITSKLLKSVLIYAIAFLVGTNFATVPALSSAFTNTSLFGLSQARLGNLFIPQVSCIVISSLVAPFLVNKFGAKKILALGVTLMLLATGILWCSQYFIHHQGVVFIVLLVLTGLLGFGFGTAITTLNPVVAHLHPKKQASAILIMQFLVVVGTAAPPLLISYVDLKTQWLLLPTITFLALASVFVLLLLTSFEKGSIFKLPSKIKIPKRLWIFFFTIIIYGFLEGAFGSFGSVLLKEQGLNVSEASIGLSLFWFAMGLNRLFFGLMDTKFKMAKCFLALPLLVGITLFFLPSVDSVWLILTLFTLCGFFMGSILPGSIGWGTVEFGAYSVIVSGMLMAADQIGTGIATNVIGSISHEVSMGDIMRVLSLCTVVIFILLIVLSKHSKIGEAFGANENSGNTD